MQKDRIETNAERAARAVRILRRHQLRKEEACDLTRSEIEVLMKVYHVSAEEIFQQME